MGSTATGNCFKVSACIVALFDFPGCTGEAREAISRLKKLRLGPADLRLVHGLVRRRSDSLEHVHSWVEIPDIDLVVDYSNSNEAVLHKPLYYRAGDIGTTVHYTYEEARALLVEHSTYGPWAETFNCNKETDCG